MKKSELFFSALLVPIDLLTIFLSFIAAYYLRLNQPNVQFYWQFDQYLTFVATLAPIWLVIFVLAGLYSIKKTMRPWEEAAAILTGVSGGTFLVIAWPFLTRQEFFSRLVVIYLFIFGLIFVTLGRLAIRWIKYATYRYGIGVHRIVVIGTNGVAKRFIEDLEGDLNLGYRVVGVLQISDKAEVSEGLAPRILGDLDEFLRGKITPEFDDLLVATDEIPQSIVLQILEYCEDHKVGFKLSPTLLETHSTNIEVMQLAGVPILEYKRTRLDGWGRILKRLADIVGSLVGILIFSPFLLLTALAVKLTSAGPIIYNNERVGDDGYFHAYKFRSMKIEYCTGSIYAGDTALKYEQELIKKQNSRSGPLYKVANDPRLTPIGQFIRTTSLDELPQLFNVLKGEMSLVGPRPHQPREVALYERRHRKLLHIKPGITGMAQISGRSDLDFEDEFRLDLYYIENWSLWLDIQIIIKTPLSILASRQRKAA